MYVKYGGIQHQTPISHILYSSQCNTVYSLYKYTELGTRNICRDNMTMLYSKKLLIVALSLFMYVVSASF